MCVVNNECYIGNGLPKDSSIIETELKVLQTCIFSKCAYGYKTLAQVKSDNSILKAFDPEKTRHHKTMQIANNHSSSSHQREYCMLSTSTLTILWSSKKTLYFYFRRTLLLSSSSGYTIGRLLFTQLFTSVVVFLSMSCPPPLSYSYWLEHQCFTQGVILLTCDHHLVLLAVCSASCIYTRPLIYSFLILSILVFPVAFLNTLSRVMSTSAFLC